MTGNHRKCYASAEKLQIGFDRTAICRGFQQSCSAIFGMGMHPAKRAFFDFVEGAASGNPERMLATIDALDYGAGYGGGWARAMRGVARLTRVPTATREFFLLLYLAGGDHIRQECGDDLALADGLRALLPRYKGGAVRLYRGEGFSNRRRRTYGLSWSAGADIAREHALKAESRTGKGGTVLLETFAPADAIICAPALLKADWQEREYILDRRRLTAVKVLERFPQLPIA
jgi:hypothetical protein